MAHGHTAKSLHVYTHAHSFKKNLAYGPLAETKVKQFSYQQPLGKCVYETKVAILS